MPYRALNAYLKPALLVWPALCLAGGLAASGFGAPDWPARLWIIGAFPVLIALIVEIVGSLRHGEFGLDIVAALSMSAALTFGEYLAAVVVALMYAGGQYLESFAEGRARREMTALLSAVPRTAMRHTNGEIEEVALEAINPGDRLMIRRGDIAAVDGIVAKGSIAILDESALTGESVPMRHLPGDAIMSGSTNVGDAFDLTATLRAADSTFAGIVRLVKQAQNAKAPMTRLADRYSLVFLLVTIVIAGVAWLLSDDPIRAVAVLVVATPCPLILAVPVALVSGLSRAASQGILIKGGKVLERLASIKSIVIDKTGTLTLGRPHLTSIQTKGDAEEVLRVAAALDQASPHTIAHAIVAEAKRRGLVLPIPQDVIETPGQGIEGSVAGKRAIVGGMHFVRQKLGFNQNDIIQIPTPGAVSVAIAIDGELVGTLTLADTLRTGTHALLNDLRKIGIERIILATGDRKDVAKAVTGELCLDGLQSDLSPEEKIRVVLSERKYGPVMMVGDGVNDAPALAAADVGVAMGARGTAASAEAADIVLLVDRLDRILPAIRIARRSRAIALQSVYAGIGLSFAGMAIAAFGYINPVQGALLQEAIDVAVIINAMRALR